MNINEALQKQEYINLTSDPYIAPSVLFWVLGGSYAYGTNLPNSVPDIRGVGIGCRDEPYNIPSFGELRDEKSGAVIYSLKKLVATTMVGKPNAFEILFAQPEAYKINHIAGQILLDNKDIFLSKRIRNGYESIADSLILRMNKLLENMAMSSPSEQEFRTATAEISKCAANAARLYITLLEALTTGQLRVFREKERENLLAIRGGCQINGSGNATFFDWIQSIKNDISNAAMTSMLPEAPDAKNIKRLVEEVSVAFLNEKNSHP